ncbi:MAG TPA: MerR family DNA-binding transcriptional regulator [Stellaceae bacterium]|nr:MerR family DNA-binding transcriptional regulator [Stellaceae bacterium]
MIISARTVPAGPGAERLYAIGDLAAEFGVSPRAIRFYEDQGLLRPQRIGGNRIYGSGDRARLQLILRGKRLGFALADIKELLDLYDVDPDHLEQLRATLVRGRARIAELERQQQEIALTLQELRAIGAEIEDSIRRKEQAAHAVGRKGTS